MDNNNEQQSSSSSIKENISEQTGTGVERSKDYLTDIPINKINELLSSISELSKYQNRIKKSEKKLVKLEDDIEKQKVNFIEIIGVFVGIFTFISVEIQVLRYTSDFIRIAGLTMIFFSGLLLFFYTVFYFTNKDKINYYKYTKREIFIFWFTLIILIFGVVLVSVGDYKNPANVKNDPDFIELENKNRFLEQKIIQIENDLSLPIKY